MTRLIALICLCLMPLTAPASAQEATATFGQGGTPMLVRSTTDIRILRPVLDRFLASDADSLSPLHAEAEGADGAGLLAAAREETCAVVSVCTVALSR